MGDTIQRFLTESPFLAVFVVFWAGAVASLSSCTLVRIPVVLGYVAGASDTRRRSLSMSTFFVLGLIFSYTLLGVFFGVISNMASGMVRMNKYLNWALGGLLFSIGLFISGLVSPKSLSAHRHLSNKFKKTGLIGAFLFGTVFAFLEMPACPCCSPVLLIIASTVFLKGSLIYSLIIFLSFAIGQSFPTLIIGLSTGLVKYLTPKITRFEEHIRLVAGNILIILGIYFIFIA